MRTGALVALYLMAIVVANVSFALYGMAVEPWISLVLIGLDLTSRDYLHMAWGGHGLVWKMAALILTGSALSAAFALVSGGALVTVIDGGILQVSLASAAAFASAGTVDALTYGLLRQRWLRVNGSNAAGAVVDSFVFPLVAFGAVDWGLVVYFAAVKFIGGLGWWLVLGGWRDVRRWLWRQPAIS